MKTCLTVLLSLALVLALAGSAAGVAEAHYGHHSRRAKRVCPVAYTEARDTAPEAEDTTPVYAACYANGYCTGNNLCDVGGVCQNGGSCYGAVTPNTDSGYYGHHGGGHHGGRHHGGY